MLMITMPNSIIDLLLGVLAQCTSPQHQEIKISKGQIQFKVKQKYPAKRIMSKDQMEMIPTILNLHLEMMGEVHVMEKRKVMGHLQMLLFRKQILLRHLHHLWLTRIIKADKQMLAMIIHLKQMTISIKAELTQMMGTMKNFINMMTRTSITIDIKSSVKSKMFCQISMKN